MALRALRTLVVEDNAIVREVFVNMVQPLGWQADAAVDGAQALALVQARVSSAAPYEAVFVDWQMPDLDGGEICKLPRSPDTAA